MTAPRVLLTRGLSNVRDAIELIHRAMAPEEFHLGATYFTEHTPLRRVADSLDLEPELENVQTRERVHPDGRREQCFLEVNPRMSGGIDMACQAGLNLPYWLLRLVAGTVEEAAIPPPAHGVRVAKIEQAMVL